MFIGEDLNERQVAALQLVADVSAGCPFARVASLVKEASNMTYRALHDENGEVSGFALAVLCSKLAEAGLVEVKDDPKRGPLVGLTHDGRRCNLIDVY
jgi:hypothetical protein